MHRFRNILFSPLGDRDNPTAVRRVADLASYCGAELTLLGVVSELPPAQRLIHRHEHEDEVLRVERQAMSRKLAQWRPTVDGASVTTVVQTGHTALSIIERVLVEKHDLVVVTSDDDHQDHATIRRLLRKCPCPVWVIRPTHAQAPAVLAAVNVDPDEVGLNHRILEHAALMAELRGADLHVVHAWELYGELTMRSSAFMSVSSANVDAMVEQERARHQKALDGLISSSTVAAAPWRPVVAKGQAWDVIPALVEKYQIDVLAMGTVARTGLSGLVMGNTAERVLDQVRCSVMACKPAGFVSPIQLPSA